MKNASLILGQHRLWNEMKSDVANVCNKTLEDPNISGQSIVAVMMVDYSRLTGRYSVKTINHSSQEGTFYSFLQKVSDTFSNASEDTINKLLGIQDDTITYLVGSAVLSRSSISRIRWMAELVNESWMFEENKVDEIGNREEFARDLRSELRKINLSCMKSQSQHDENKSSSGLLITTGATKWG